MNLPQIKIRLNKDVANVRCENDGVVETNSFSQGEVFVTECRYIADILSTKQYVASNDKWQKIYFSVEDCDELSFKLPMQL